MTTESKYQLVSLDESYMSDLSDENQSTVSGGTLGLLFGLLGGIFKPLYGNQQPTTTTTVINNIYVSNGGSSSASAGSSSGSSSGGSSGPGKGH